MSIHQFLSSRDPQMNFRWVGYNTERAMGLDPRYVERVNIPWARFESMPIYVAGSNKYYHSVNEHDPISMSFYVDKDLTAINCLQDWSKKVFNQGRYGLPKDYKKTIGASILANDSDAIVATFLGVGAWPTSLDELELTYSESGRLIVTATLSVDEIVFISSGSGSNSAGSSAASSLRSSSSDYDGSNKLANEAYWSSFNAPVAPNSTGSFLNSNAGVYSTDLNSQRNRQGYTVQTNRAADENKFSFSR